MSDAIVIVYWLLLHQILLFLSKFIYHLTILVFSSLSGLTEMIITDLQDHWKQLPIGATVRMIIAKCV